MGYRINENKTSIVPFQSGSGAPSHLSPRGSIYVDNLTGTEYINKDGYNTWAFFYDSSMPISGGTSSGGTATGAYLPLSGGTVYGPAQFTGGVSANTLSSVQWIDFSTATTVTQATGRVFYNVNEQSLAYYPDINQPVTVNIGQQLYTRVGNVSGTLIPKGSVVSVTGSTNGLPSVILSVNNHEITSARPIGLAADNIPNNGVGLVINNGILSGITLNAFNNGDTLYLSPFSAGTYVSTTSNFPFTARTNEIGYVIQTGTTTGKIYVNINNEDSNLSLTDIERNILEGNVISTGVYEFTGITKTSNTTFDVSPLRGWIVYNTYDKATLPDVKNVRYSGQTGLTTPFLTTTTSTYVLMTSGGTISLSGTAPTPQERRENIFLGKIIHPNKSTIQNINNTTDYDVSPMSAIRDLFTPIKLINESITISANGANLTFNQSYGRLWGNGIGWCLNQLNPNMVIITAQTPTTFQYRTQTGGTFTDTTTIDPTYYDVAGVRTLIPGNLGSQLGRATNHRVYLFTTGLVRVQYGQNYYQSLTEAIAAIQSESFVEYINNKENGILIGVVSATRDCTSLNDTTKAKISFVSKFGELFGGTGGISTTTLQQAYNNSSTPEIVINAVLDGLTIKNGTGNPDSTTHLLEGVDTVGNITSFITADGTFSGSTFKTPSVTANNNGLTATTISATTYLNLPSTSDLYLPLSGGTVSGLTNFQAGLLTSSVILPTYIKPLNTLSVLSPYYSAGTISQSGNTIIGTGTTFLYRMIGSQLNFSDGTVGGTITGYTSSSAITVTTSQSVSGQSYYITSTSLQVDNSRLGSPRVGIRTSVPLSSLDVLSDGTNGIADGITVSQFSTFTPGGGPAQKIALYCDNSFGVGEGRAIIRLANTSFSTTQYGHLSVESGHFNINSGGHMYMSANANTPSNTTPQLALWNTGNSTFGNAADAGYKLDVNGTSRHTLLSTFNGGILTSGNISAAAWGNSGINFLTSNATYIDTSSTTGSTVTNNMVNVIGVPILATTNTGITYTDAASLYIAGAPTSGANTPTITNPWGLMVNANIYNIGRTFSSLGYSTGVGFFLNSNRNSTDFSTGIKVGTSNATWIMNNSVAPTIFCTGGGTAWSGYFSNPSAGAGNTFLNAVLGTSLIRGHQGGDWNTNTVNTVLAGGNAGFDLTIKGGNSAQGTGTAGVSGNLLLQGGYGTVTNSTSITNGYISFSTVPNSSFGSGNLAERMRVTQSGNILIGTTTDVASAILNISSTTQGFLPPRMTTTQVNAITSPATGLQVFDNTLNVNKFYNGTAWDTYGSLLATQTWTGANTFQTTSTGTALTLNNGSNSTTFSWSQSDVARLVFGAPTRANILGADLSLLSTSKYIGFGSSDGYAGGQPISIFFGQTTLGTGYTQQGIKTQGGSCMFYSLNSDGNSQMWDFYAPTNTINSAGLFRVRTTDGTYFNIDRYGTTTIGAATVTSPAWGLNGIQSVYRTATYTDNSTASNTVVANNMVNVIGTPTLATTNTGVTYTNAATVYIAGAPSASGVTLTNPYALWVNGTSNFTGNAKFNGSITNNGTYGNTTINAGNNQSMIVFSGSNTVGGTGYTDFIKVINTSAGATNQNKTIRLNNTGGLEFLNSDYTSLILSISDNGILNIGGGAATTTSNDANKNFLAFNSNNSQIYDDTNLHIHSRLAGGSMWLNTNGGQLNLLNQSPLGGGAIGTGVAIGNSTTLKAFTNIYGSKTYTIGAYGYVATIGAGTGGGTTAPYSLYCDSRIEATEFDATSDERLKDVQGKIELTDAINLVKNIEPIIYTWKDSEDKSLKAGYSAQQVVKSGFKHLVSEIPNDKLVESTDEDGFTSPEGFQLTMNYDQVIPYHGTVIKYLLEKIELLEKELQEIKNK